MFSSQKNMFWIAFTATLLIFGVGIVFGIILENWRIGNVDNLYQSSEIYLMDIKLQSEIYSSGYFNCENAVEENINFANRIYDEAKLLDKYESASTLSQELKIRHKKYDLLRANLWLNSIKLKNKCNTSYDEIVYIYKYENPSLDIKAKQEVFSRILSELKQESKNKILLIPFAGDIDSSAINLLLDQYSISKDELPIIILNGKTKISDVNSIEDLKKNL